MKKDPIIERVRGIRHQISAEHSHDPKKVIAHYRKMEQEYKDRILKSRTIHRGAA